MGFESISFYFGKENGMNIDENSKIYTILMSFWLICNFCTCAGDGVAEDGGAGQNGCDDLEHGACCENARLTLSNKYFLSGGE